MRRILLPRALQLIGSAAGVLCCGCYETTPDGACRSGGCDDSAGSEADDEAAYGDSESTEEDGWVLDSEIDPIVEVDTSRRFDVSACVARGPARRDDWIGHFEDGTLDAADEAFVGFQAVGDGTSTMAPPFSETFVTAPATTGVDACSDMVMHVRSDAPFTEWGAGVRVRWGEETGGVPAVRDLSAYRGIRFWFLRHSGASSVWVSFADANSHPAFGACEEDGGAATRCYNEWGTYLVISSEDVWESRDVLFEELRVQEWGLAPDAFLIDQVVGLRFLVSQGTDFDFYIDDIYFIR